MIRSQAARDCEDTKRSLCLTRKVTDDLKNLTAKIDQLQALFHDTVQNFNLIGNSSVRLSQFESILKALEAEKEPMEEIKEQLQKTRRLGLEIQNGSKWYIKKKINFLNFSKSLEK